jgi:hypothetical protein
VGNAPVHAGFAVRGPVILLGNPEDHPIIKYLLTEKFLPYVPSPGTFPGVGRGILAWQRDGIGRGQESITLIAYDEAGMSEAVGSFYEAVAGLEPLTRWTLPQTGGIVPAKMAPGLAPAATVAWTVKLPDRVVALRHAKNGWTALTHDGSLSTIDMQGKLTANKLLDAAEAELAAKELTFSPDAAAIAAMKKQERPDRMAKLAVRYNGMAAVAYWGGTLRVVDSQGKMKTEQQLPQDITAMSWTDGQLAVGLADGQLMRLDVK